MSSESKKKRGESGRAKAAISTFRLNGRHPDWQARSAGALGVRAAESGGSTLMRGILGGCCVAALGLGPLAGEYERRIGHAQSRVTHPLLR